MYATHFVTPLPDLLASHVFGRFVARTPPGGHAGAAVGGMDTVPTTPVALEMDEPDLAQRVRELGEW